ncbi:hypothetical protein GCM10011581_47360 [Saccharopolyspora subtropica]|uniref:DUF742 domain-containing protein n=1 Tax=Saccharopolyspora thermophila TaxID=89367 RepID=A0A917NJB3_9PSEU|nr:DUF742 domain-containing protein [Saccharopolyspora subtropica]GGJ04861.1 hypothetical protein GCM10011581_47360 [Saccharopolyspora subtropica]
MSTGPDPSGRHRWGDHDVPGADAMAEVFNRFTLDSDRRERRRKRERDEPAPQPAATPASEPPWPKFEANDPPVVATLSFTEEPSSPGEEVAATYIRPYAWTGGRTRSNHRLELETLVSTSESCDPARLHRLEHHTIAGLCWHSRSVAEVGALLGVPLGVAKVLLSDMADLGLITVHHTVSENGSTSHLMLMERVLSGLRRL